MGITVKHGGGGTAADWQLMSQLAMQNARIRMQAAENAARIEAQGYQGLAAGISQAGAGVGAGIRQGKAVEAQAERDRALQQSRLDQVGARESARSDREMNDLTMEKYNAPWGDIQAAAKEKGVPTSEVLQGLEMGRRETAAKLARRNEWVKEREAAAPPQQKWPEPGEVAFEDRAALGGLNEALKFLDDGRATGVIGEDEHARARKEAYLKAAGLKQKPPPPEPKWPKIKPGPGGTSLYLKDGEIKMVPADPGAKIQADLKKAEMQAQMKIASKDDALANRAAAEVQKYFSGTDSLGAERKYSPEVARQKTREYLDIRKMAEDEMRGGQGEATPPQPSERPVNLGREPKDLSPDQAWVLVEWIKNNVSPGELSQERQKYFRQLYSRSHAMGR